MVGLVVLAGALLWSGIPHAQSRSDDIAACESDTISSDLSIAACTRLINSGTLSSEALAVHHYNRGISWGKKRDYVRALADYTESLRVNPGYANAWNNRADAHLRLKDHAKAVADATQALALDPAMASSLVTRGKALVEVGEYDRAISDYTSAVRLEPSRDFAYYLRGLVFMDHKRDYSSAIRDFTSAIRLDPAYGDYPQARGRAHARRGDFVAAISDYSEAIRLNPKQVSGYADRAIAHRRLANLALAMADLSEAIRIDPGYAWAHAERGSVRIEAKDYDGALGDYQEAVRLEPINASFLFGRSAAWYQKRNYTQSLFDSLGSIKIAGEKAPAAHNRAAWLMATAPFPHRDGRRAIALATRACELTQWKQPVYIDTLAAAYAEAGDFAEAVKWQQRALETPGFDDAAKESARERMELYRKGQPYRLPPAISK